MNLDDVDIDQFESLAADAIDTLPKRYAKYLTDIPVIVEDWAGQDVVENSGNSRERICGVYIGNGRQPRFFSSLAIVNRIELYRGPLVLAASSLEDLKDKIRATLEHELGHHLGLGHDKMGSHL